MRMMFVHRSFPGQFQRLVQTLASTGRHQIVFGTGPCTNEMPGIHKVIYQVRPASYWTHVDAQEFDAAHSGRRGNRERPEGSGLPSRHHHRTRDALACGCSIIAADTAPVREFITDQITATPVPLLYPATAERVLALLDDAGTRAALGSAARRWGGNSLDAGTSPCRIVKSHPKRLRMGFG